MTFLARKYYSINTAKPSQVINASLRRMVCCSACKSGRETDKDALRRREVRSEEVSFPRWNKFGRMTFRQVPSTEWENHWTTK